jgi:hypothetical protein
VRTSFVPVDIAVAHSFAIVPTELLGVFILIISCGLIVPIGIVVIVIEICDEVEGGGGIRL